MPCETFKGRRGPARRDRYRTDELLAWEVQYRAWSLPSQYTIAPHLLSPQPNEDFLDTLALFIIEPVVRSSLIQSLSETHVEHNVIFRPGQSDGAGVLSPPWKPTPSKSSGAT